MGVVNDKLIDSLGKRSGIFKLLQLQMEGERLRIRMIYFHVDVYIKSLEKMRDPSSRCENRDTITTSECVQIYRYVQ